MQRGPVALLALFAACAGSSRDAERSDDTLPQHPDAVARLISVRPVGATDVSAAKQSPLPAASAIAGVVTPSVIPSFTKATATYVVGPGQAYTSLSQVAGVLQPGDVVDVVGDATYSGGVRFLHPGTAERKIVIRGVLRNGKRPVISGGADGIEAAGDHYVFEGLEITGAENRCFFHHADDITLRDSLVRDCPGHGVLGADTDAGSLTMEFDEVRKCGKNGPTTAGRARHQIYMATDERAHKGATFRLQHSWIHDGNGGNNVKSRAERNEIYYNWIENGFFHELEMVGPDGQDPGLAREDSDVVGNVFVKANDFYVIRAGGDGTGATNGRYRFVSNTFVVTGARPVFRLFDGIESVEMSSNAFVRLGGGAVTILTDGDAKWSTGKRVVGGEGNFIPDGSDAPAEWRGTVTAADAGLEKLGALDLRPTSSSPLREKGSRGGLVLTAFPIDRVLPFPEYEPQHGISPAVARPAPTAKRAPTIGAFEPSAPRPAGAE